MTKPQNIKMLMGLGFPKDIAEKMSADIPDTATATPEEDITAAMESCVTHQRALYTNSDDYKEAIKQAGDKKLGEINTKYEKKIIALAQLTTEEVKGLKADEIIELAFKKAMKMNDKTAEDIQLELNKKLDEIKRLQEEEIPAIRAQVEAERIAIKSEAVLTKDISALGLREGLSVEDALIVARSKAEKAGYKIVFNDKGEMGFTNADGSRVTTEDKRGFMENKDILGKLLDGMIKKSNAGDKDDPKKKHIIEPGGENKDQKDQGSVINANLSKAEAHAEKLRAGL